MKHPPASTLLLGTLLSACTPTSKDSSTWAENTQPLPAPGPVDEGVQHLLNDLNEEALALLPKIQEGICAGELLAYMGTDLPATVPAINGEEDFDVEEFTAHLCKNIDIALESRELGLNVGSGDCEGGHAFFCVPTYEVFKDEEGKNFVNRPHPGEQENQEAYLGQSRGFYEAVYSQIPLLVPDQGGLIEDYNAHPCIVVGDWVHELVHVMGAGHCGEYFCYEEGEEVYSSADFVYGLGLYAQEKCQEAEEG